MDKKQRKVLEAKAQKMIKAIMRQYQLFSDTAITITFKQTNNAENDGGSGTA